MELSIHGVKVVSIFRESGLTKLSILDRDNRVTEVALFGDCGKNVLLRDSDDRVPIVPSDFGV